MDILKKISEDIKKIDINEVEFPEKKIGDDQTVVGVISDDSKRLWGLINKLEKEVGDIADEYNSIPKSDDITKNTLNRQRQYCILNKFDEKNPYYELLRNLFWLNVRLEFPELIGRKNVRITENGQIYWESSGAIDRTEMIALLDRINKKKH